MSENNETGSFATTGSGKSEAEVAFDLLNKLKGQGVWGERNVSAILDMYAEERNVSAILDMYAECLDATKGLRAYAGQNRIDVPIKAPAQAQAQTTPPMQAQTQAQVRTQTPAAPAQRQAAPQHQTPSAQPVHAQQLAVQQAFKQG